MALLWLRPHTLVTIQRNDLIWTNFTGQPGVTHSSPTATAQDWQIAFTIPSHQSEAHSSLPLPQRCDIRNIGGSSRQRLHSSVSPAGTVTPLISLAQLYTVLLSETNFSNFRHEHFLVVNFTFSKARSFQADPCKWGWAGDI